MPLRFPPGAATIGTDHSLVTQHTVLQEANTHTFTKQPLHLFDTGRSFVVLSTAWTSPFCSERHPGSCESATNKHRATRTATTPAGWCLIPIRVLKNNIEMREASQRA